MGEMVNDFLFLLLTIAYN